MFEGAIVALVTPFKDGAVDYDRLAELVEFHIEKGTNGILPCGTTGESPTLSHDEHNKVVETVVKKVDRRIPVIAGAGSNSTEEALSLTRHAKEVGADAVLSITPYYNKPMQKGMIGHFTRIATEVDIPIVLYNVPGRTGVNLLPETVAELSRVKNIVAVKEASGNISQICDIISRCDITVLSGDDSMTFPLLAAGGKGVISVAANVIPSEMAELVSSFPANIARSRELHYKYWRLFKDLFIETNPIPVKAAMEMMGLLDFKVRLPLSEMSEANKQVLRSTLSGCGLI
ncbi:4-hydroxy-tetrahydrodipicolinate synthase [bacterium]|nr:4-hydroxy-tetrahydrodipicolinate synthase [bacterium]